MSYYQLDDDIENNNLSICYICFENKEKLKLECNHTICKECLISWIKSRYKNKCPWCKKNITQDYLTNQLKLTSSEIRQTLGIFTNGNYYGNDGDANSEYGALKVLCLLIGIIFIIISTQQK